MTRKDYELIAETIAHTFSVKTRSTRPEPYRWAAAEALTAVAENLASELAVENPRFDPERFLKASGVVE